jgi:riboflavin synthase
MFTGIIESVGVVSKMTSDGDNIRVWISCPWVSELSIDQSVAHDGICLTVDQLDDNEFRVTAIKETIQRTALSKWKEGHPVNLERSTPVGGRLDGHIVQGHVDSTGTVKSISDENGSWKFVIEYNPSDGMTVEKGSICVNGISLTVVDSKPGAFSVAIIPYTYEHTNLRSLKPGDPVNLEFDIIGKYIAQLVKPQQHGWN